jgi:hypothetical protein
MIARPRTVTEDGTRTSREHGDGAERPGKGRVRQHGFLAPRSARVINDVVLRTPEGGNQPRRGAHFDVGRGNRFVAAHCRAGTHSREGSFGPSRPKGDLIRGETDA